jgi:ribosomal protein S18 acetylase RimI-like enzyme
MMQTAVRAAKLGRKYSHVLVAAEGPWLVGALNAAVWPHCQLGAYGKLKTAPAIFRAMGWALTRQLEITRAWEKHEPYKPHWNLGPIGVHPLLQGRGIGKALLQSFLAMVDEQGLAAYLETDVDPNVALYEKFGFRVIAQEELNGINNRFMWRDPRPSRPGIELQA